MGSSKKNRGKQRKAAKQQTAAAASSTPQDTLDTSFFTCIHPSNELSFITTERGDTYFLPEHHKLAALYVQKGDGGITVAMEELTSSYEYDGITRPNISLVRSGILSSVLGFLGTCEHETFDGVMADAGGNVLVSNGTIVHIGGNLDTPSRWIRVLFRAGELEPDCMMQIVENISPLVKCMCNDMARLFFQSNRHWKEGIESFVRLIGSMISKSIRTTDREVANTLLQYEGLLTSIVQWIFWKDHRPDIVKVLGMKECTLITEMGRHIVGMLVTDAYHRRVTLTTECKILMWSIGTTPIVNREYDQTCITSFNEGFIHRTKELREGVNLCHELMLLQVLVTDIDCVDKGVITALIDFGLNFTSDYNSSAIVAGLSSYCLKQSDTRVSFAIRSGLIEMCLNFIERFGRVDFFKEGEPSFCRCLENIFITINTVSLHQKTAKAIKSKKIEIQGALARLERKSKVERALAGRTNDMNDDEDDRNRSLLDMIRSITDLSGSYCCRCSKPLTRTEVKQCNGCHRMTYCSKACQREDWLNGHSIACCKTYTDEKVGQFQGRLQPTINEQFMPENERDAAKLKELESNIAMVQLKLFLENAETILNQAISLDLPLHDCVVRFDLRACPPAITLCKYSEFFYLEATKDFEETRSEENITCVYASHIYTGVVDMRGDVLGDVPLLIMQRLFPHEWLTSMER